MTTTIDRRNFSKLAAGGLLTARSYSQVVGANDRVRMGLIGAGGRGTQVWKIFLEQTGVEAVGVADVYDPFGRRAVEMAGGKPKLERDFRRLLDRKDIDAVIVATPDHWHATQTVAACQAGKDVYTEKPLTLVVAEGRPMVEAARRYDRIVQTGSQQRSGAHYAEAAKRIAAGKLGTVHEIRAASVRNAGAGFQPKEITGSVAPPELDWDMWLGPAPKVAFDPFRCIYNFRWFWDYSGGQMTNWGAHHLDIARWFLGQQAPETVASLGGRYVIQDGGETPDLQEVLYQFPKCLVTWSVREANQAKPYQIEVHGTKGTMRLDRSGFSVEPEGGPGEIERVSAKEFEPMEKSHVKGFLACVRSRQRPAADVEEGHRTATMCHLGNLSMRLGRSLRWNAAKEEVEGDAAANKLLRKTYRAPWKWPAV